MAQREAIFPRKAHFSEEIEGEQERERESVQFVTFTVHTINDYCVMSCIQFAWLMFNLCIVSVALYLLPSPCASSISFNYLIYLE